MLDSAFNANKNGFYEVSFSSQGFTCVESYKTTNKLLQIVAQNRTLKGECLSQALYKSGIAPSNIELTDGTLQPAIQYYGKNNTLREVIFQENGRTQDPESGVPAYQRLDPTNALDGRLIYAKSYPKAGEPFSLTRAQLDNLKNTQSFVAPIKNIQELSLA